MVDTADDKLLTVTEVAEQLRCGVESVRRWIADGSLPARTLPGGRTYRIRESDLRRAVRPVPAGE